MYCTQNISLSCIHHFSLRSRQMPTNETSKPPHQASRLQYSIPYNTVYSKVKCTVQYSVQYSTLYSTEHSVVFSTVYVCGGV